MGLAPSTTAPRSVPVQAAGHPETQVGQAKQALPRSCAAWVLGTACEYPVSVTIIKIVIFNSIDSY